jgi:hypothetical protein
MVKVRAKAKELGLKTNMKKDNLIRAIQTAEGNFPCFKAVSDYCDQAGCCFRSIGLSEKHH